MRFLRDILWDIADITKQFPSFSRNPDNGNNDMTRSETFRPKLLIEVIARDHIWKVFLKSSHWFADWMLLHSKICWWLCCWLKARDIQELVRSAGGGCPRNCHLNRRTLPGRSNSSSIRQYVERKRWVDEMNNLSKIAETTTWLMLPTPMGSFPNGTTF